MAYSDWTVAAAILDMFRDRADGQIMGLELLTILLVSSQFAAGTAVLHVVVALCAGLVMFAAEIMTTLHSAIS